MYGRAVITKNVWWRCTQFLMSRLLMIQTRQKLTLLLPVISKTIFTEFQLKRSNIRAVELFNCFLRARWERVYGRAYNKECTGTLYIISYISAVNDPNQTNNCNFITSHIKKLFTEFQLKRSNIRTLWINYLILFILYLVCVIIYLL